jgi:hypothetical protein
MASIYNDGAPFPLEHLTSDLARSNYNIKSMMDGMVRWQTTEEDSVQITLAIDSAPWYCTYQIPSRKNMGVNETKPVSSDEVVYSKCFANAMRVPLVATGGKIDYPHCEVELPDDIPVEGTDDYIRGTPLAIPGMEEIVVGDFVSLSPIDNFEVSSDSDVEGLNGSVFFSISDIFEDNQGLRHARLSFTDNLGEKHVVYVTKGLEESATLSKYDPLAGTLDYDGADLITSRVSVNDGAWSLWCEPAVADYNKTVRYLAGTYVRFNEDASEYWYLKRYLFDSPFSKVTSAEEINDGLNRKAVWLWENNMEVFAGDIIIHEDNAYYAVASKNPSTVIPENDPDSFVWIANRWKPVQMYSKGTLVFGQTNTLYPESTHFYLAKDLVPNLSLEPWRDAEHWDNKLIIPLMPYVTFSQSAVIRNALTTSIQAVIPRNETDEDFSNGLSYLTTLNPKKANSIYQKKTAFLSTTNYELWPTRKKAIWQHGAEVLKTDESKPICKRQSYSGSMIFDHGARNSPNVIYLNYDGPDLDQGLCLYFLTESTKDGTGIAFPEDGYTYDLVIRIWPDPTYNGMTTRDHIVNKSQVYLYSAPNKRAVEDDTCEEPLAKFSLARMTNFYTMAENIFIPDKPVVYTVKVMYSTAAHKWLVADHHQWEDHVFVGPFGFVDPTDPRAAQNGMSGAGSAPLHVGWETAAFPTYQDPFSNTNLTPYKSSQGTDLDLFSRKL